MSAQIERLIDDAYRSLPLPKHLVTTDRVLQRWAVSVGNGLPSEDWDDRPISKPPPLDDWTAIVVDQIVVKSPPKTYKFIRQWYKSHIPSGVIVERMGMDSRHATKAWWIVLEFMLWKFEGTKHRDLLRMLKVQI